MGDLNIPFIRDRIESTHKSFIDSVGQLPDKITADHQFLVKRMATRINLILRYFVESEIIDENKRVVEVEGDNSCFGFKLTKKGYDKSVYIYTDGYNIIIKTANYPHMSELNFGENEIIRSIDFDTYNWVEFVDKLLHFIHQIIYEKMKSYENNIFKT